MLTSHYIKRDQIANVKMSNGQNSELQNKEAHSEKKISLFQFFNFSLL